MLKIKDWASYQSYKDRNPPWIRFHKKLLDNFEFQSMSVEARALLPMLWLMASEDEDPASGLLRKSYESITFRLRMGKKDFEKIIAEIIDAGFVEEGELDKSGCFIVSYGKVTEKLRKSYSETETETETETEAETESMSNRKKNIDEIFEFWKVELDHPQSKLDAKRKKAIEARLAEDYSVDRIKNAIRGIKFSPHHMGQNDRDTVYDDIELICRSGANVDKFAEMFEKSGKTKAQPTWTKRYTDAMLPISDQDIADHEAEMARRARGES